MSYESNQANKFDNAPFAGPLNKTEKDGVKYGKKNQLQTKLRSFTCFVWSVSQPNLTL